MTQIPQVFKALTLLSYLFFHWKGQLTHSSIQMKLFTNPRLANTIQQWSLIYFEQDSNIVFTKELPIIKSLDPITIMLDNLKPLTTYEYFFYYDPLHQYDHQKHKGKEIFKFKTFAKPYDKQNLSFAFSSCAKTGSEDSVFSDIIDLYPENNFFIQMGDIFYSDITEDNQILFDESYYRIFQSRQQNRFYQYYPLVYIWDDHDFGDNNAGESSKSKDAATISYLKNAPYYPLRALPIDLPQPPNNRDGIYQYMIAGQTLIIIMDLRTHFRLEQRAMDEFQEEWLLTLLKWCELNQLIDNLVVVSSIPWLGQDWVSFKEQRTKIGEQIGRVNKVKQNVLLISGDSHMNAFDNGYNNDAGGFAHCVSSPLDKTPSCKGGKYTHGPFSGNQQYSNLEIKYNPETQKSCFLVKGYGGKELLYQYDFCNESDRNIKRSNSCFTSIGQILIVSVIPLLAVLTLILCIWKRTHKFTAQLSKSARSYQQIPSGQKALIQEGINQNYMKTKNNTHNTENNHINININNEINILNNNILVTNNSDNRRYLNHKGKSQSKLSQLEIEFDGNISKSPSQPSQLQPNFLQGNSDIKILGDNK